MHFWLFKSEPKTFSIDNLKKQPQQTTCWDGVRNYQARNFMRTMQVGDRGFFYHSNANPPGIVGIVEVVKTAHPDFTAWDMHSPHYDADSTPEHPRWFMVDVRLVEKFDRCITLDAIKQHSQLRSMQVARKGNRLSITPVTPAEWQTVLPLDNPRSDRSSR